jgi:hypothetical protein
MSYLLCSGKMAILYHLLTYPPSLLLGNMLVLEKMQYDRNELRDMASSFHGRLNTTSIFIIRLSMQPSIRLGVYSLYQTMVVQGRHFYVLLSLQPRNPMIVLFWLLLASPESPHFCYQAGG